MSGWQADLQFPIVLDDGRTLLTLRDAGEYITELKPAIQRQSHWQLATEMLLLAAQGKIPRLMAQITMQRALNHGKEHKSEPRRKAVKKYRIVR